MVVASLLLLHLYLVHEVVFVFWPEHRDLFSLFCCLKIRGLVEEAVFPPDIVKIIGKLLAEWYGTTFS